MAEDEVRLERHGDGTATVRIDRPQARNALDIATRKALAEACREVAEHVRKANPPPGGR